MGDAGGCDVQYMEGDARRASIWIAHKPDRCIIGLIDVSWSWCICRYICRAKCSKGHDAGGYARDDARACGARR